LSHDDEATAGPHPRLAGSALKLKRAKTHLNSLKQSIDRFREEHHYRLTRHDKAKGRLRHVFTWDVEQAEPFPFYWPILVGEVLYQLHSALDHLAWELAFLKTTPEEPDRITFPMYTSAKKFWRRNDRGTYRYGSGGWRLCRVPADARRLILEVQPYKRGDAAPKHPLAMLFTLSNEDKHKALHLAWAAATRYRLQRPRTHQVSIDSFKIDKGEPFDGGLEAFASLHVTLLGPQARIEAEPGFVFEEVFGKGSPTNVVGEPVWDTLRVIYNYVVDDIFNERFGPLFERALPR
jgi:hypothetical protein